MKVSLVGHAAHQLRPELLHRLVATVPSHARVDLLVGIGSHRGRLGCLDLWPGSVMAMATGTRATGSATAGWASMAGAEQDNPEG